MAVLKLKTAPTVEPLTLDEVKQHCRIDTLSDDVYLNTMIIAVRRLVEEFCGPLITQTWEQYENDFPNGDSLRIWKPRITTFTSLTYTNSDNTTTTLSSTYYTVDDENEYFPAVVLNYNYSWPTVTLHPVNPIKLTYICGYGATAATVPETIRQAMLILAAHWYENREPYNISISGNSVIPIPWTVEALLTPYRVYGFEA